MIAIVPIGPAFRLCRTVPAQAGEAGPIDQVFRTGPALAVAGRVCPFFPTDRISAAATGPIGLALAAVTVPIGPAVAAATGPTDLVWAVGTGPIDLAVAAGIGPIGRRFRIGRAWAAATGPIVQHFQIGRGPAAGTAPIVRHVPVGPAMAAATAPIVRHVPAGPIDRESGGHQTGVAALTGPIGRSVHLTGQSSLIVAPLISM